MNNYFNLSDLSIFATLLLFILYFIGRIWAIIFIAPKQNLEKVFIKYEDENSISYDNEASIVISSSSALNWIEVHNLNNDYTLKEKKDFDYTTHEYKISLTIPCGIPTHKIRFQRIDYMIGEFEVQNPGKDGSIYNLKLRHCFLSTLYYLLK